MSKTPDTPLPDAEFSLGERKVESLFGRASLWAHLVLLGVVTAGTVTLIVQAYGYSANARRFPLIVFWAILAIVVMRAIQMVVGARMHGQPTPNRAMLRREPILVGWIVAIAVLVVLIGLLPGAIAFLALYLAVHRPVGPIASVGVVVATWAVMYLIFVVLLDLPPQSQVGLLFS